MRSVCPVRVAQLLRENELRLHQQATYFRIAAALGESLSLSDTLDALAQAAQEALNGAFAAVLIPRGATMELAAGADLPPKLAEALEDGLPESADCLRAAADDGHVLASPDVTRDDRFEQPWQSIGTRAADMARCLQIPAASPRAETFCARRRVLCRASVSSRTTISSSLAISAMPRRRRLERSELFEAERTTRALSQQLARTGGVLATRAGPGRRPRRGRAAGAGTARGRRLRRADTRGRRARGQRCLGRRAPRRQSAADAAATARLSGDVFQSRSPLALDDARSRRPGCGNRRFSAAGYAAYLGVPLSGPEGTLAGVLVRLRAASHASGGRKRSKRCSPSQETRSAALANAELYSRVSLEKERSVAILANIADGIVAVDRDGRVVLWNAAAEEITGVPQERGDRSHDDAGAAARARVARTSETRVRDSGSCRSCAAARKSGCR